MNWINLAVSKVSEISVNLNLRVSDVSAAGCSAASEDAELAWWIPRVVPAFSFTAVIPWPAAKMHFRWYDVKTYS